MPKDPCSELAATITKLAMSIGARPEMKNLADVTAEMQKHLPEITRDEIVNSIVEATTGHRAALDETKQRLADLKREARRDKALRDKIGGLERNLAEGTLPMTGQLKRSATERSTETVKQLRGIRDELRKKVEGSDPAVRARLEKQIESLAERLESGVSAPPAFKGQGRPTAELERLTYQRDRLRREINQRIQAMRPRTFWQKAGHTAIDVVNIPRTLMSSVDFSAVFRQGGFVALGHPVRAARSIVPMLRAFGSERQAQAIDAQIRNRPNAPLYDRSKLYLSPLDGSMNAREEAFMSRLAGKLPLVSGSQRAYVTFLNKLRADSFDAMAETLGRNGEVTLKEATAISNFLNVATGRSSIKEGGVGTSISTVFFSPRYMASRFQLLAGQPLYGGTGRTRALVAQEYGRYLAGVGVVYLLGSLGGGSVETDPRSSDFGKITIGDTRIDPLSGLAQDLRLIGQLASGERKNAAGKVVPVRGKVPYGQPDAAGLVGRFLRYKLAPAPGSALDLLSGRNAIGQPVTPEQVAAGLVTPMSLRDIADVMHQHGIAKGTAIELANFFGMGVQHYGEERRRR